MPRTALVADAADRFDPWGFGTTAADEPTVVVDDSGLVDDDLSPLSAFDSRPQTNDADAAVAELVSRLAQPPARERWRVPGHVAAILAVFLLVILGQAFYIGFSLSGEVRASAAPTGELVLSSHPAGARVAIDGRDHGVTPLVVTMPVGTHHVAVFGQGGVSEAFDANVTTAGAVTRHLVLAAAAAPAVAVPAPSAAIRADAVAVAPSPVRETPVARAAIPAGPAAGWLRVQAPFAVQVFERGQLVGSSASERILVTAGAHVFELVNDTLGYRTTMKAVVGAGRTEALTIDVPHSAVQVNALPWAEVLIDGRVLGETPLANLQLPIGAHQLVFRHPDLGERTQTVTVRLDGPNRVTADLRR